VRPFNIYSYQPPDWKKGEDPHPAVIVSHRERAGRNDMVEVVICSTQRANRPPSEIELLLDEADGLD
jgi:mRNA-degrading endonuclease toxin of MazEF toxin-antitoxin module